MSQFKGSVGYIGEKRFGGKTFYSFTLKGTDGFFRLGLNKPKFSKGGYVEFEADDALNVIGEVKSVAEKAPEQTTSAAAVAGTKPINFREEADSKRQKSIHFQSAHKAAVELAIFMAGNEYVKMPTTPSKKYEAMIALVNELTDYIFAQFEAGKTDVDGASPEPNAETDDTEVSSNE